MFVSSQMKPDGNKTDYTECSQVCFVHYFCGACELIQIANVAERRKAEGHPVVTPISNPAQMQVMQAQLALQQAQLTQQQAAAAAPAAP